MFSRTDDLPDDCEPTTTWTRLVSKNTSSERLCTRTAYNLREIKRVVADGVEDEVLQLVHHAQQIGTERCHGQQLLSELECECAAYSGRYLGG